MASIFSNEFYEHLYRLEEQSDETCSWVSKIGEDNEDLQWCRQYINSELDRREKESLEKGIRRCYAEGLRSLSEVARGVNTIPENLLEKLEKHHLTSVFEALFNFWNGVILQHSESHKVIFVRSRPVAANYLGAGLASIKSAMCKKHRLFNHYVYQVSDWLVEHPGLNIDEERLINEPIIEIA